MTQTLDVSEITGVEHSRLLASLRSKRWRARRRAAAHNLATMENEKFLLAHRATLEPQGDGWELRYMLSGHYDERRFAFVEATLQIRGTHDDALQIAELVLRDHRPPELPAVEPAAEPPPPPSGTPSARPFIRQTRGNDRRRPTDLGDFRWSESPA
jgi:hypothetical protein